MNKVKNPLMLVLVAVVLVSGVGLGYSATHVSAAPAKSAINITLVIDPNRFYNASVGNEPSYYVLDNGSLQSAEYLYLPQYSIINLTIIDWDSGASPVAAQYASVYGTAGSHVLIFNNTAVNDTSLPSANSVPWVTSYVNVSSIAHTFTVSGNGMSVNIPVQGLSTEQATFTTAGAGQSIWTCNAMCGTGPDGNEGPMVTPGWMWGYINVL